MSAQANTPHPAAALIGERWTPEHNCWWLVREYFARCRALALPEIDALAAGVRASGWRPVQGIPQADDIVLMRAPEGTRHVGVMLAADARLWVLHSDGGMVRATHQDWRCWGGVVWQPIALLIGAGYRDFEFWRFDTERGALASERNAPQSFTAARVASP